MENSRSRQPLDGVVGLVASKLETFAIRNAKVCLALSGGVDSVALLAILHDLRSIFQFGLEAAHVNHGLSPDAQLWENHCRTLCDRLGVPLTVHRVQVDLASARGLEAAAREARFDALTRTDADFLFFAHHRGDQAETILYRLLRGAGVRGVGAMRETSYFARADGPALSLVRPLLDLGKSDLRRFAVARGLTWVHDGSNEDSRFARNFLRRNVLPCIESRFPAAAKTLARASQHFSDAEHLMRELATVDRLLASGDRGLDLGRLRRIGEVRTRNLIRFLMHQNGLLAPDYALLREAVRQVFEAKPGCALDISLGEAWIARFGGGVFLLGPPVDRELDPVEWRGQDHLPWCGGRLSIRRVEGRGIGLASLASGKLVVDRRRAGDRVATGPNRPRRRLKDVFSELRVPPWERSTFPIFRCGDAVVAIGGLLVSPAFACAPGEPGIEVEWGAPRMVLSLGEAVSAVIG